MKYKFKTKKIKKTPTYRVYFDVESGAILSITNRELGKDLGSFIVPVQEVEDFLAGTRNMTKHRVVFNVKEQQYQIVSNQENIIVSADDLIFRLTKLDDAQIIIQQCLTEKRWKIFASAETRKNMQEIGARLEEILFFSITEYGNPNILYNHYYVSIRDIIENDFVEFDFTSQEETVLNQISVYTNRKFDKYSHEVINE